MDESGSQIDMMELTHDSSTIGSNDRAAKLPGAERHVRSELAVELLRGSGIEIGALHLPMAVPAGVRVRYVDRMTVPELRAHYPELSGQDLARVDVLDDGELLSTFEPEPVDFIIANHFLEHCADPVGTIATHLTKVRHGGVLFYAVPDKRYTFDFRRPRTPLSHVVADHEDGGKASRAEHYVEYTRLVYPEGGEPPEEGVARAVADQWEASGYSIHFHVLLQADLLELMLYCQKQLDSFDIEAVRRMGWRPSCCASTGS
jgi:SAM-dependent methyltransferase